MPDRFARAEAAIFLVDRGNPGDRIVNAGRILPPFGPFFQIRLRLVRINVFIDDGYVHIMVGWVDPSACRELISRVNQQVVSRFGTRLRKSHQQVFQFFRFSVKF